MDITKCEKLPLTRLHLDSMLYCDVVPSTIAPGYVDVWLCRTGYGVAVNMFGTERLPDEELLKLIEANVPYYIDELMRLCEK